MLYIRLFHGRVNPDQDMNIWGSDGPVFGPYEFAHMTYACHLRLAKLDGVCDELHIHEDLLYYDACYYGDWSVFGEKSSNNDQYQVSEFEQSKANLPVK